MEQEHRQIIANYVRCKCCGTVLQSLYGHDYKKCGCDNETMADGGLNYGRYGGVDLNMVECTLIYNDAPFEVVRQHMYRTGYGKDRKGVFRITRLFEMTDEHLRGVLDYGCADWQRVLILNEISYRKLNNISVA